MDNINEVIRQSALDGDISTKYLTFQIDGQHYGISIAHVIEIVQLQPVTELPELPCYVKGIINLRGQVVPLIDVNLRFGKPEREYTDRTCVIIVDIDRVHVGLIVDPFRCFPLSCGETQKATTFTIKSDGLYLPSHFGPSSSC